MAPLKLDVITTIVINIIIIIMNDLQCARPQLPESVCCGEGGAGAGWGGGGGGGGVGEGEGGWGDGNRRRGTGDGGGVGSGRN